MAEPRAVDAGYEPDDVRTGRVLLVAAGSLVVLALTGGGLWGMVALFADLHPQPPATAIRETTLTIPPPRLQPAPKDDLAAFQAREQDVLHRWAWIDRDAGTAQIPIEDAMQAMARRGWPQPDRAAELVPTRAQAGTAEPAAAAGRKEPAAGPATVPRESPSMSPREEGPLQATPKGGQR